MTILSQSPPPDVTQEHMAVFLKSVCLAIGFTQEYDPSLGKTVLWMILLGLILEDMADFYEEINIQGFLSYSLKIFNCEYGVVIATSRDFQLNVNVFIPCSETSGEALYDWMNERLKRDFYEYAVDLRPILRFVQFPKPYVWKRTMIPSTRRLKNVRFDAKQKLVAYDAYAHSIIEVVSRGDIQRLSSYRPLQRMEIMDEENTRYWHRFPCDTIVGFCNPYVELHDHCQFIRTTFDVEKHLPSLCKRVVAAMKYPHPDSLINLLEIRTIPSQIRRVFVRLHRVHFGITDTLIVSVGSNFENVKSVKNLLLCEICIVYNCMRKFVCDKTTHVRMVHGLMHWLDHFQFGTVWRKWTLTSPFLYALMKCIPTHSLQRACGQHTMLFHVVAASICEDHGDQSQWTREIMERAHVVCEHGPANGIYVKRLRGLYNQRMHHNLMIYEEMSTPKATTCITRTVPTTSTISESDTTNEVSETPSSFERELTTTHHELANKITQTILHGKYKCTLIGSGVFYNGSDVDMVVHVPHADTLEKAHEEIQRLTGWKCHYDRFSENHISVIQGEFNGVKVDLQVYRSVSALERTRAEEETHRALILTRHICENTDDRLDGMIRHLHTVFDTLGLKGHCLCRFPGVAVTCIAIDVARRLNCGMCPTSMMRHVRERFQTDIPYFQLEHDEENTSIVQRPSCSAQVVVYESNIATRLTASITRHMLDVITAFTLNPKMSVSEWKTTNMITCLRMRPLDTYERVVALTLHSAAAKIDGHPLIDTAYIDTHEDHHDVLVRVTLKTDVDAARYGFRGTEQIQRVSILESIVMVSRSNSTRQWPLCTHPCKYVQGDIAESVGTLVSEKFVRVDEELCVPNAPHLLCDLCSYFDNRYWERIDV